MMPESCSSCLPHSDALTIIQRVLQLIPGPHTEISQHQTSGGDVLPFMLMVSNRGALAQELYDLFQRLSDLSAMRLIGSRLRPHRQRRQPLGPDPGASGIRSVAGRPAEQPERRGPVREWPAGTPACPVLLNPGQICYMNASVTLLHWLVQASPIDLPSPYGVMQAAFGSLKAGLKLTLTNCLPWLALTRDWFCSIHADIHVQQDAVAFAEFLLHRANIPAFRGTCWVPLLVIPGRRIGLAEP